MDDTFVAEKLFSIFVVDLADISSATATTTPQTTTLMKTSLTKYADMATKKSTTDITYTIAIKSQQSSVLSLNLFFKNFQSYYQISCFSTVISNVCFEYRHWCIRNKNF